MDFDDYETPVKSYLDDRYLFRGIPTIKKYVRMYLTENEVESTDSLISLGQSHQEEFISVDRADTDLHVFTGTIYFEILLVLSPEKVIYTRDVFSFFDLFGQLGGVFELLNICFGLIIGYFSKPTFLFSIFKRLYHTEASEYKKDIFDEIHKNQDKNKSIRPFEKQKPKQMVRQTISQYEQHMQSVNTDRRRNIK